MTYKVFKLFLVLVFGIAIGCALMWWYSGELNGRQILDSSYPKIIDDVNTLALLQNKSYPELLDEKELELSETLFGLSRFANLDSISESKMRYLRLAAGYRKKYPYQSQNTNIDSEVETFLQKVRDTK